MRDRHAFVFGRRTGRLFTLLVLCVARPPIVGPWVVRAIVSSN